MAPTMTCQTASFALFLGKGDLAKQILEDCEAKNGLLRRSKPDGRQPLELVRTEKALGLQHRQISTGLMLLAQLGERPLTSIFGTIKPNRWSQVFGERWNSCIPFASRGKEGDGTQQTGRVAASDVISH